eukprot:TRINITY_DN3973_c0_g1_i1.p1 TRINITY_DN3973_c0_g1~~TRINITY_DN3973_c0_g1_i1.p1  ORF type:complete len:105 (-),score=11.87 TRINITY_DN3973_c0_g1_i1:75-389(-)
MLSRYLVKVPSILLFRFLTLELGKQETNFRNDLYILFEACISAYRVQPKGDITPPRFFTHNMEMYKKFLAGDQNEEKMEQVINLKGLEHLIEVLTVQDIFQTKE